MNRVQLIEEMLHNVGLDKLSPKKEIVNNDINLSAHYAPQNTLNVNSENTKRKVIGILVCGPGPFMTHDYDRAHITELYVPNREELDIDVIMSMNYAGVHESIVAIDSLNNEMLIRANSMLANDIIIDISSYLTKNDAKNWKLAERFNRKKYNNILLDNSNYRRNYRARSNIN